jgi:NADH dehydrogenase FAD-containing subunit
MWKRYSHLNELQHKNLHFKHGSVQRIDPAAKVAEWLDRSGKKQEQPYDYVIVATGLKRHWPAVPKSGSYDEFLRDSRAFIDRITGGDPETKSRKVVIIGAGAVGVEFAGEIKNYYPGIHVTLVHSRSEVLSSEPLPTEVKEKARTLLVEEGVDLVLESRASIKDLPDGTHEVTLANGTVLHADFIIDATKKGSATTGFLPAEILNEEKEILVNPQLTFMDKVPNAEFHFGVGDVIAWSGIKRAGGAMVMGELAASNVYASILNSETATATDATATSPNASAPITLGELPFYNNVIGLAVGKQCLTYDQKNGMKWGVQLMKDYFQDDLGWKANLKYLQLSDVIEGPKEELKKDVVIGEVGVEAVSAKA